MNFLQPLMLVALVGAAVPIIIHLIHKRRPRKQPFAAIEFVLRSVQRVQRRWRLKRFLLLASRVLLLAALALAAARPMFGAPAVSGGSSGGPERIAVVIDASLSMRASYGDRTAFARAVTLGRNLVDALGPEDQMVLVAARKKPELLMPRPISSRSNLLRALTDLQPTYGHAELAEAITLAAKALTSEVPDAPDAKVPAARIVVLSDLAGHSIRAAADLTVDATGRQATLELIDVLDGVEVTERKNHAITEARIVNVPGEAPRTIEARVRIRQFTADKAASDEPEPRNVTLHGPTGELYAGSVDVVPGTVVDKALRHSFGEPGYVPIRVALEADALEEDDVRYAMADVRHEVRTLIIDGAPSGVPKEDEIFYLERALAMGARDQPPPRVITADDLARADLGAFDVVVLAGVPTIGREDGTRIVEFVERGGGLLITAAEGMDIDQYNAELARVLPRQLRGFKTVAADRETPNVGDAVGIVDIDVEHPVMQVFRGEAQQGLRSTRTLAYLLLHPDRARPATTLAAYEGGQPALIEARVGRGRTLVLTTSIDRAMSDLPIRPAFLPLVRRTILHLGNALARPERANTLVGDPRALVLPDGTSAVEIVRPDAQTVRLSPDAKGKLQVTDTALPGHYRVLLASNGAPEAAPELDFAVNIDASESDLRPLTVQEATAVLTGAVEQGGDSPIASAASIARRTFASPERVAGWLLLVMLLAFAMETLLTARRPGR